MQGAWNARSGAAGVVLQALFGICADAAAVVWAGGRFGGKGGGQLDRRVRVGFFRSSTFAPLSSAAVEAAPTAIHRAFGATCRHRRGRPRARARAPFDVRVDRAVPLSASRDVLR